MEKNSAINGWIFVKIGIWVVFRKSLEKIKFSLKFDKLRALYMHSTCTVHDMPSIAHTIVQNYILYQITFLWENLPFMRKCGKNIVEPDRPQMAMWRMRIACRRIPKATNTHSQYVWQSLLYHNNNNNSCTDAPQRYVIVNCLSGYLTWYCDTLSVSDWTCEVFCFNCV